MKLIIFHPLMRNYDRVHASTEVCVPEVTAKTQQKGKPTKDKACLILEQIHINYVDCVIAN